MPRLCPLDPLLPPRLVLLVCSTTQLRPMRRQQLPARCQLRARSLGSRASSTGPVEVSEQASAALIPRSLQMSTVLGEEASWSSRRRAVYHRRLPLLSKMVSLPAAAPALVMGTSASEFGRGWRAVPAFLAHPCCRIPTRTREVAAFSALDSGRASELERYCRLEESIESAARGWHCECRVPDRDERSSAAVSRCLVPRNPSD